MGVQQGIDIGLIISTLNFLLTWGIGFYVHITSKNRATNDRLGKLEADFDTRMDGHGERIARLEEKIEGVPTHDDLAKIYERLNEATSKLNHLTGESSANTRILNLVYESLIDK